MARGKPISVGPRLFKTQKDAIAFIRELLNTQPFKVVIPEPHHSFLCALISLHPHAEEKLGSGAGHFTVEPAMHGTRCFYLTRSDGSKTDFSYLKCLRGQK